MAETKVKLGQEVRDKVTGYQGIAVSVVEFLYGCRRIGIQAKPKKGEDKPPEVELFDEPQLEIVSQGILPEPKPKAPHGDPAFKPQRARTPTRR